MVGLVIGLILGFGLIAGGSASDSPVGYEITEPLRVVRVFDADAGEWITEIWPLRCTVFEDGSARCPSYP